MSTEPEQTEDDFQKELIDLFGQEAQEWLGQIHSALAELEGPDHRAGNAAVLVVLSDGQQLDGPASAAASAARARSVSSLR